MENHRNGAALSVSGSLRRVLPLVDAWRDYQDELPPEPLVAEPEPEPQGTTSHIEHSGSLGFRIGGGDYQDTPEVMARAGGFR